MCVNGSPTERGAEPDPGGVVQGVESQAVERLAGRGLSDVIQRDVARPPAARRQHGRR